MSLEKKNEIFLTEFIELYRAHPCLWKIKSKDYMDKHKKAVSYEILIEKMREIDASATKDTVVKKINNLRSAFRKELKKVNSSKHSGMGEEDIYVPHLWYYELLTFLADQETPRPGMSNIEEEPNSEENDQFHNSQEHDVDPLSPNSLATTEGTSTPPTSSSLRKTKRSKKVDASEAVLEVVSKRLATCQQEDEYDAIGKNIASKLRRLNAGQQIFAEKIISDVLYEAQLETLSRNSKLLVNSNTNNYITRMTTPPTALNNYNDRLVATTSTHNRTFGGWAEGGASGFISRFNPDI